MFYSESTGCCYISGTHGAGIPGDAVPISEERYNEVIANPAPGKIRSHDADGLPILIDPPAPTADELRAATAAAIATRRYQQEIRGFEWGGYHIATDRESQSKISDEDRAVEKGLRTENKGWKCLDLATNTVGFRATTNAEMQAIAAAAYAYVSNCFLREEALLAELEAGTYTADMLDQGWPA